MADFSRLFLLLWVIDVFILRSVNISPRSSQGRNMETTLNLSGFTSYASLNKICRSQLYRWFFIELFCTFSLWGGGRFIVLNLQDLFWPHENINLTSELSLFRQYYLSMILSYSPNKYMYFLFITSSVSRLSTGRKCRCRFCHMEQKSDNMMKWLIHTHTHRAWKGLKIKFAAKLAQAAAGPDDYICLMEDGQDVFYKWNIGIS